MAAEKGRSDSRVNVARYRVDKLSGDAEADTETDADGAGQTTMDQRAQYIEIAIEQAIRRGDFDDLPGAGKPLPGLNGRHDPDWWIRRKIEREKLTGLGPPALTLRTENAALEARIDAAASEGAVRELLGDFNARVTEARRQLQGGPPVVTPLRDIEAEVAGWAQRRADRAAEWDRAREQERARRAALTWRERRRESREQAREQSSEKARREARGTSRENSRPE